MKSIKRKVDFLFKHLFNLNKTFSKSKMDIIRFINPELTKTQCVTCGCICQNKYSEYITEITINQDITIQFEYNDLYNDITHLYINDEYYGPLYDIPYIYKRDIPNDSICYFKYPTHDNIDYIVARVRIFVNEGELYIQIQNFKNGKIDDHYVEFIWKP